MVTRGWVLKQYMAGRLQPWQTDFDKNPKFRMWMFWAFVAACILGSVLLAAQK